MNFKRVFDILFSCFGLFILFPLWVLISMLIFLEDGLPIYFYDTRVGKGGKTYKHLKFRSMIKSAERNTGPVYSLEDDCRITKLGRILRKTAMDELPQIINIFKGDMSFVGPRSERPFFVEKFLLELPNYDKRFSVRPGLTGMAQVYGKHNTPAGEKLVYDLLYIKKMNIFFDINLIAKSILITILAGWEKFDKGSGK